MQSHRLIREGGPRDAEWRLEWDDDTFTVRAPDGQRVLEADRGAAHRVVDLFDLYAEGKISFPGPHGTLTFRKQKSAAAALRRLVEAGLAKDPEFRTELGRQSRRAILRGLVMFVGCGGLFGLYCWYASWAPDPPPGHWIRWFGWLIHLVLLLLMGFGIAGLVVAHFGLKQWRRVRRIERAIALGDHVDSGDEGVS